MFGLGKRFVCRKNVFTQSVDIQVTGDVLGFIAYALLNFALSSLLVSKIKGFDPNGLTSLPSKPVVVINLRVVV